MGVIWQHIAKLVTFYFMGENVVTWFECINRGDFFFLIKYQWFITFHMICNEIEKYNVYRKCGFIFNLALHFIFGL